MAKRRGKKLKNKGSPEKSQNTSKKIEKRSSREKKKTLTSTPITGPGSTSNSGGALAPSVVSATSSALAFTITSNGVSTKETKKDGGNGERISGFIFMCSGKTKPECYRYRVFGLPVGQIDAAEKVKMGMKLFLFDFDLKLLYGIYKATSNGKLGLEPDAFNGRFPAQVRFKIKKDCLPLPESAFKHAIRDNYHSSSKFRPELSSRQVKTLISLFRPITVPLPTSVASPLPNVVLPHSIPASMREERFHQSARMPPPEDPYLCGMHNVHVPTALDPRSAQVALSSMYNCYGEAAHVACVQPLVEPLHAVQQASFPHYTDPYYLAEAHRAYLPQKPVLSTQDPYGRYWVAQEMVPRDQLVGRESDYHMTQLSREKEIVSSSESIIGYYSQPLPMVIESHASLQANALGPSYAPLPLTLAPGEVPSSYHSYHAMPTHEDPSRVYAEVPIRASLAQANVSVSSIYSFAGATPIYR